MSSLQKPIPVLSWDSPRDTGGNRVAPEAARNIRYGWLSALDAKDTKDLCRRSLTNIKRVDRNDVARNVHTNLRPVSAPPMHGKQPAEAPSSMPPSSKEPPRVASQQQYARPHLCQDLIDRTRYLVVYVTVSLTEIDAKLDAIILGQDDNNVGPQLQFATNCSLALGRVSTDWRQLSQDYWGMTDEPTERLPGPASLGATKVALAELIQILLVEGACLFGRAQFDPMEIVRRLCESCIATHRNIESLQSALDVVAS